MRYYHTRAEPEQPRKTDCRAGHSTLGFSLAEPLYFEKPFKIFKGDTLRITCTYDNSPKNQPWINGVQEKPRYIVWGESTQDEMCIGNIQGVRE